MKMTPSMVRNMYILARTYDLEGHTWTNTEFAARALVLQGHKIYDEQYHGKELNWANAVVVTRDTLNSLMAMKTASVNEFPPASIVYWAALAGLAEQRNNKTGIYAEQETFSAPSQHGFGKMAPVSSAVVAAKTKFKFFDVPPTVWYESIRERLEIDSSIEIPPSWGNKFVECLTQMSIVSQVGDGHGVGTLLCVDNIYTFVSGMMFFEEAVRQFFSVSTSDPQLVLEAAFQNIGDRERDDQWNAERIQAAEEKVAAAESDKQRLANELEIYSNSTWS